MTIVKYDQFWPRIFRLSARNTVQLFTFFVVSRAKRHIMTNKIPTVFGNLGIHFLNVKVIYEYLPILHPTLKRLSAKICPVLVLFSVNFSSHV